MNNRHIPRVALLNATHHAIGPAAFELKEVFDDVEIWNITDDRLRLDAEEEPDNEEKLAQRMQSLIKYALKNHSDAVLVTCSLYSRAASTFTSPHRLVLGPDEAMFRQILVSEHRVVLVLATFDEALTDTMTRLRSEIEKHGGNAKIIGAVIPTPGELEVETSPQLAQEKLADILAPHIAGADAIALAQYSLTPLVGALENAISLPVFSGPKAAAAEIFQQLQHAPTPVLGVIADDFTGAIDTADALNSSGIPASVIFDPDGAGELSDNSKAHVVALKTRSIAPELAVSKSLAALQTLRNRGAERFYFKYCSTFDSTPRGNIGPVIDALMAELDVKTTVTTPSAPNHGRTVVNSLLFVGGVLLEKTHMAHHPLNPMRQSDLIALLEEQSASTVQPLTLTEIHAPQTSTSGSGAELRGETRTILVADALTQSDLSEIALHHASDTFMSGSAGLVGAWGSVLYGDRRDMESDSATASHHEYFASNQVVIFAGSSSVSTRAQLAHIRDAGAEMFELKIDANINPTEKAQLIYDWHQALPPGALPVIYSSASPEELQENHRAHGAEFASHYFETSMAQAARLLYANGVENFIVAGGETSGAVVEHLGIKVGKIGSQVCTGVSWLHSRTPKVNVLLKSGNFGTETFFTEALESIGTR